MTHQNFASLAHARTRVSLLVLVLCLLTAASAAAAAPTSTAPAPPAVPGADPAAQPAAADQTPAATPPTPAPPASPVASTPAPAPAPTPAGPTGGTQSDPAPAGGASANAASPLATEPVTQQPTPGDALQPQQVVIAAGSATSPIERPAHDPSGPPSAHASSDQPVVSTTSHLPPPPARATVTQLASGGSLVAASPATTDPVVRHPAPGGAPQTHPVAIAPGASPRGLAPGEALTSIAAMSVPLVDVYIGRATSPHHADFKASPASVEPPVGPSGLTATSSTPFGDGSLGHSGQTALFGNAPFSTASGSVPLLGLNAMLAAVTLLAGLTWRRRSWDLPVLAGESALLASALDRPG